MALELEGTGVVAAGGSDATPTAIPPEAPKIDPGTGRRYLPIPPLTEVEKLRQKCIEHLFGLTTERALEDARETLAEMVEYYKIPFLEPEPEKEPVSVSGGEVTETIKATIPPINWEEYE